MAMRGYAKPVECTCTHNFTCGHCLRNAPPWFYTLSDGSAIAFDPSFGIGATLTARRDP